MRNILLFIFISFNLVAISQATWTRKADFGGVGRGGAVGFSIGNKGYVGTGWN